MFQINKGLYQFTDVLKPMGLSMHQYLLMTEEPILIQTGSISQARLTLPDIKKLLNGTPIKFILISHFESDECGGLSLALKEYPEAVAVCSETTARQLSGFGITGNVAIKKPGEALTGKDYDFRFIGFPSEMHLWEGLLFVETRRGFFFSSDLLFQLGETHGQVVESDWEEAIVRSGVDRLPDSEMRKRLMDDLHSIEPNFIASGHGPCIKIIK